MFTSGAAGLALLVALVCDEITSGLDTVTRRGILDVLEGLLRDRDDLSFVLITHDLDTARPYWTRESWSSRVRRTGS